MQLTSAELYLLPTYRLLRINQFQVFKLVSK